MHVKKTIGLILSFVGLAACETVPEWGYSGELGPANWGNLSPAFATCAAGVAQSPIDLGQVSIKGEVGVTTNYGSAPITVIDSGHGVKADIPLGQVMTSGDKRFGLLQFHFHTPSEHVINGRSYPLAVHLVHATQTGELGVLGVFFEEGPAHPTLDQVINNLGAPAGTQTFDTNSLLPAEFNVFRYQGSLTTPPCTEGVNWHVATKSLTASRAQIAAFHAVSGANARPVLPLGARALIGPK